MRIFDGRAQSGVLDKKIIDFTIGLLERPQLIIIQVGNNLASQKYVDLKMKVCRSLGIESRLVLFPEDASTNTVIDSCRKIFLENYNAGFIVQLPLPRPDLYQLLNIIPQKQDLDMLSQQSKNLFYSGDFTHLSPVVRSVAYFLNYHGKSIKQRPVVIIGDGELVGKPLQYYLSKQGAYPNLINNYSQGQKLDADLVILGAGVPNLVVGEDLPKNCNVIDFGSTVISGKTVGDFDTNSQQDHLGLVSFSPGGMGPVVVRMLILNLIDLCMTNIQRSRN